MTLNHLSIATIPLPKMGRDFLLTQDENSIFRHFSLCIGESIKINSAHSPSYLYAFLGSFKASWTKYEKTVQAGDIVKLPVDASRVEIQALTDTFIYHIDMPGLDKLVTWMEISRQLSENHSAANRLNLLMNFSTLQSLPVESMFELGLRMTEFDADKDSVIFKQGDQADAFYVIVDGQAEVWQTGLYDDEPKKVATLVTGDSFGEDALVISGTRNASIHMTSDSRLLKCDKADFQELVATRCIDEVEPVSVPALLKQGHKLIDVRYEEEHEESYIDGATLVPLNDLRTRLGEFKQDKEYVIYCRSGKRSAVAALIMSRAGLSVTSMTGGILAWPHETQSLY